MLLVEMVKRMVMITAQVASSDITVSSSMPQRTGAPWFPSHYNSKSPSSAGGPNSSILAKHSRDGD